MHKHGAIRMNARPRTLDEIRSSLLSGTTSVRSLVLQLLDDAPHGAPSAWISRVPDAELLRAADASDALIERDGAAAFEARPLLGALFAVKDNIDVAGLPTTAGCPSFASGPATQNAAVVQRLVDAGAIPVGKTNLDQFATGLVGTRSPHGAVPNPFDSSRVSGGSSSGSAYAVSTGQVPFALGTDTAGSGRVPASFCNISGLKPTRGWLSSRGVVPACRGLDCVSIFALSPEDAWAVARIAAGPDPLDPFSRSALPPKLRLDKLAGLRIGVPQPLEFFGDALAAQAFDTALGALKALGCAFVDVPYAPLARAASLLYDGPWVAERYAAVGAFLATHPADADPTVAQIVLGGATPLAHELFSAQYEIQALQQQATALWNRIDVMVVPSAPTHPTLADLAADPLEPNRRMGHYTNFVNLLDMAAHALPGPFRADGLPAGITLIGPAFSDFALAQLAATLVRTLQPTAGVMRHALPATPVLAATAPAAPARIVVVGAHMAGLALNWQFTERAARLLRRTTTAPAYRLYSLTGTQPTRPGLVHVGAEQGQAIEVEVWEMDSAHVGSFLALVGAPLALGTVELADGSSERGFVCESRGVAAGSGALDITAFGGWHGFLVSLRAPTAA
jgi:allophanate hydrolase